MALCGHGPLESRRGQAETTQEQLPVPRVAGATRSVEHLVKRGERVKQQIRTSEPFYACNSSFRRVSPGPRASGLVARMATVKVLPLPGSLSTDRSPPKVRAKDRLLLRPSPVPPYCRVVELSA